MSPVNLAWKTELKFRGGNYFKGFAATTNDRAWMSAFLYIQYKEASNNSVQSKLEQLKAKINGVVMKEQVKYNCDLQTQMGCSYIGERCVDLRCDAGSIEWPPRP